MCFKQYLLDNNLDFAPEDLERKEQEPKVNLKVEETIEIKETQNLDKNVINNNIKKVKIEGIIFREDLYPRFEPNQQLIKKYSESLEYLPPIKIDQHNILIDGFHRLKAHELIKENSIKVEIIEVKSERELKQLAYKWNSNHGLQLTNEEKKQYAIEMIGESTSKDLVNILSVNIKSINRWTKNKRELLKKEKNRRIIEEYLRAWNTQESIVKLLGIPQQTISDIIDKITENGQMSKIGNLNSSLFLYNIWNTSAGNKTEHFGSFPKVFMDNLLHFHTKPLDIVYDPFCGDGITIDSCKKIYRRYYCSDLIMKPGRESDMKERAIQEGYPNDLQKPQLVFLDPPYWKQSEGKYSKSKKDLSNVSLEEFYEILKSFLNELMKRKIEKIAIIIQPTQYKNDFIFEDHIFKFHEILCKNYFIEMRYILPYSTQQYNAQMVNKAKKENKCLVLNRDLVIWRLKK